MQDFFDTINGTQMLHVWIIYLHEQWKMATFKGEK